MATPTSNRDPEALSTEYHKAHKQAMLWAGILLIWELVGVDLSKAEAAGGTAGAIITAIKSPQAIPWVLVTLTVYFLFKFNIEWYQCSLARRNMRVAKVDFASAWIVSLSAFILYLGQTISRVQFADFVQNSAITQSLILGFCLGALGTAEWKIFQNVRNETSVTTAKVMTVVLVVFAVVIVSVIFAILRGRLGSLSRIPFLLLGTLIFPLIVIGIGMIRLRIRR